MKGETVNRSSVLQACKGKGDLAFVSIEVLSFSSTNFVRSMNPLSRKNVSITSNMSYKYIIYETNTFRTNFYWMPFPSQSPVSVIMN